MEQYEAQIAEMKERLKSLEIERDILIVDIEQIVEENKQLKNALKAIAAIVSLVEKIKQWND